MIDIHSHILPGVDDGARTLEESIEMLRIAARAGTTDIVATPHASPEFPYDEPRIQHAFDTLRTQANGLINLHLACDFHLSYENLRDALNEPAKYTINHYQYLMVELPDLITLPAIKNALIQLISRGIVPVITHPERNISLQSRPDELASWVRHGALLQVTAQSFSGRFGPPAKQFADSLLRRQLIHFVASDAHDCRDRTPDLAAAFDYIASRVNRPHAEMLLIQNPAATLRGDHLPEPRKSNRKLFGIFKLN